MSTVAIRTEQLIRTFGSIKAVDQVDLHVPEGGIYGFLGPNGAGKTTTIRMLLGLIQPDSGQIELFGQRLDSKRRALLGRVGALVEHPSLYLHLTGRENLAITCRLVKADMKQIERVLDIVGLMDTANRLVKGYSQGMRQRLGLALALLNDPELLILDEPTNGLDPAGIHEMRDLIRQLPVDLGVTVFLSSHLLAEVEQVATHIGIIYRGRLLFQGTQDELHAEWHEHVVVGADQPEQATNILKKAGWQVQAVNGHLQVMANQEEQAAQINRLLVEAGLNIHHLKLEKPTLEDLFLHLTREEVYHDNTDKQPAS